MKKFIVLAVAALSMNAFASKHMVSLYGYEGGNASDRSLDFSNSTGDNSNHDNIEGRNIALNYAYEVMPGIQVGAIYKSLNVKTNGDLANPGDKTTTMGLNVTYNFAGQLSDTNYATLGYTALNAEESDVTGNDGSKTNVWNVDFGHRFSLGTIWGMNFNYSPSASLQLAKTSYDKSGDADTATTSVTVNFVKFDVLF